MTPSEDYCLIRLTRGQFAKVSPHRFEELSKRKWYANWSPKTQSFYAQSNINMGRGKRGMAIMHRLILGLETGDPRQGEHANCDTLDNRDSNLRVSTQSQNLANRRLSRGNKSGFKGVSWGKKERKWKAQITFQRKVYYLGLFMDPKEAHAAYIEAAREYFGEFMRPS